MLRDKMISALGMVLLAFSVLAFLGGSGPFHPALVSTFITVPAALIMSVFGYWRMPVLIVFFSAMAWLAVPLAELLTFRIDYLLVTLLALGLLLGCILYSDFRNLNAAHWQLRAARRLRH